MIAWCAPRSTPRTSAARPAARNAPKPRPAADRPRRCHLCDEPGHDVRRCPRPRPDPADKPPRDRVRIVVAIAPPALLARGWRVLSAAPRRVVLERVIDVQVFGIAVIEELTDQEG